MRSTLGGSHPSRRAARLTACVCGTDREVMDRNPVRVAVICASPIFRHGIAQVIAAAPDAKLVTTVETVVDLEPSLEQADVVVMNVRQPVTMTEAPIAWLHQAGKAVVVLSSTEARRDVVAAVQAGAFGYLSEQAEESELLTAIRTVAAGRSYICASLNVRRIPESTIHITDREKEILQRVSKGETDREIARSLKISENTVHSHLDRLRDKTCSRRRADLTRFSIEQGIIPNDQEKG